MAEGKPSPRARRKVGPEALKAFAHPLRIALFNELQRRGSATASQLARALDESSGQTSYHLRQLERHGFVEDDPTHSGGRERWWRPGSFELNDASLQQPDTAIPAREVIQQVIAERAAALTSWLEDLDPDEEGAGQLASSTLSLTDVEAEELAKELMALVDRRSAEVRDRPPPPGARRFRVHADVFPLAAQPPPTSSL